MTPATKASKRARNRARCNYRFANDGRCRLLVPNSHAHFCVHHSKSSSVRGSFDLAATLTANLHEFKSAAPINDFLARLLLALAHDQISPRRAAVLAYITNQLLRTVAAIERENDRQNEAEAPERTIIGDMPRPARENDDLVSADAAKQPHKQAPIERPIELADHWRNQPPNLPAPFAKESSAEESPVCTDPDEDSDLMRHPRTSARASDRCGQSARRKPANGARSLSAWPSSLQELRWASWC